MTFCAFVCFSVFFVISDRKDPTKTSLSFEKIFWRIRNDKRREHKYGEWRDFEPLKPQSAALMITDDEVASSWRCLTICWFYHKQEHGETIANQLSLPIIGPICRTGVTIEVIICRMCSIDLPHCLFLLRWNLHSVTLLMGPFWFSQVPGQFVE